MEMYLNVQVRGLLLALYQLFASEGIQGSVLFLFKLSVADSGFWLNTLPGDAQEGWIFILHD